MRVQITESHITALRRIAYGSGAFRRPVSARDWHAAEQRRKLLADLWHAGLVRYQHSMSGNARRTTLTITDRGAAIAQRGEHGELPHVAAAPQHLIWGD